MANSGTRFGVFIVVAVLLSAAHLGMAQSKNEAPPSLACRWVFITRTLGTDADLQEVLGLVKTAAEHKYTGILFDPDFTSIAKWTPEKTQRVRQVADECRKLKLDVVAMIMSAGYGNGVVSADHNLAEGIAVKDVPFEVKNGQAQVAAPLLLSLADGRLETAKGHAAAGFDMQDAPGKVTFVDTEVVHSAKASLRFEPAAGEGRARIQKDLPKANKHYVLRFWAKAAGPKSNRLVISVYNKNEQTNWYPLAVGDQWQLVEFPVLTGDNTDTRVYVGMWGAKEGKFWLTEFEIFEPGLVNVLRRPGTPLVVTAEDGEALAEGKDFQAVADPAWRGSSGYHNPPAIKVLPGGKIKDGDKLKVSYYSLPMMRKGQIVACMSEEQTYEIWKNAAAKTQELVRPDFWFLDMDEVRGGGTCKACKDPDGTAMTPAQILGNCITRQAQMIRALNPKAEIALWGDMLDPEHNAKSVFFTVPGGYAGSWNYIPKDLILCPWNDGIAEKSLAHFSGLGMRTIAGAYYDEGADLKTSRKWVDLLGKTPKSIGIIYFTWENKFQLMGAFGDMVASAPIGGSASQPTSEPASEKAPVAKTPTTDAGGMRWSFEGENPKIAANGDGATLALTQEAAHVTEGKSALKVTVKQGTPFGGIVITDPDVLANWGSFKTVVVDIFNPADKNVPVCIRLDDAASTDTSNRLTRYQRLTPGANRVSLELASLACTNGKNLDPATIKKMIVYVSKADQDVTLVFDNLRLEGGK